MKKQQTIKSQVAIEGKGLHKGKKSKIIFSPLDVDAGVILKNNGFEYKLDVDFVADVKRGTTLKYKKSTIYTVEHLLSAIKGLGIDNILIDIEGDEPPALDGSSFEYCKILKKAKILKQNKEKEIFKITKPCYIKDNDRFLIVLPYDKLKIYYFSDFSKFGIAPQEFFIEVNENNYIKEISKARTFGFKSEIEWLYKAGLIKGADFNNAILIDKGKPVNTRLRYSDELTRHKVLDIIGDFCFLPGDLYLLIIAVKTGHRHNIEVVKQLLKN